MQKQKKTASGSFPARVFVLTVFISAIVIISSYLHPYIAENFIIAGLVTAFCLYFAAVLFAAVSDALYRACITLFGAAIMIVSFALIINATGLIIHFQTHETMVEWIHSLHGKAELVYVLVQFSQVIFLPLPALVIILAGTLLFGAFKASLLSLVGIMLGSLISFFAGRLFGKKLAVWIAGEDTLNKYLTMISGKDKVMLTAMFILPFFPDDMLCTVAGLTSMSVRYFLCMTLVTRTISVFTTAYLGSGNIIPYKGWGLAAWAVLVAAVSVILVLLWRNAEKIQAYIERKFAKKNEP